MGSAEVFGCFLQPLRRDAITEAPITDRAKYASILSRGMRVIPVMALVRLRWGAADVAIVAIRRRPLLVRDFEDVFVRRRLTLWLRSSTVFALALACRAPLLAALAPMLHRSSAKSFPKVSASPGSADQPGPTVPTTGQG